jgi:hypothetical protein
MLLYIPATNAPTFFVSFDGFDGAYFSFKTEIASCQKKKQFSFLYASSLQAALTMVAL